MVRVPGSSGRRRSACGVAIAVGLLAVTTARTFGADEITMARSLVEQLQRTTMRIVSGRMVVTSRQTGGRLSTSSRHGDRSERLTMDLTAQLPSVYYQQESEQLQLFIEIVGGRSVRIRLVPGSDNDLVQVDFSQQEGEPLTLSIGSDTDRHTVRGDSLWHLLLVEPELCRQHLEPLLELWRPGWHLMQTSDEIENALFHQVSQRRPSQPARWRELVDLLGDERFSAREAAFRELRRSGPAVLTFLRGLDPEQLDAEQWFRVRRLISVLSATYEEDTPQRVAAWLAPDARVWLAMLNRDDQQKRRVAAQQLEALWDKPIDFDPAADSETRDAQVEKLWAQFQPGTDQDTSN